MKADIDVDSIVVGKSLGVAAIANPRSVFVSVEFEGKHYGIQLTPKGVNDTIDRLLSVLRDAKLGRGN